MKPQLYILIFCSFSPANVTPHEQNQKVRHKSAHFLFLALNDILYLQLYRRKQK